MKQKQLLTFLLLLVAGVANAITVQVSLNPSSNGTFSGESSAVSGYYTTWTSNAASGLAGLTITTGGKLAMCQKDVNVSGYGNLLALKTTTANTSEDITITAPIGYKITGYSLAARLYSSTEDAYRLYNSTGGYYTIKVDGNSFSESSLSTTSLILKSQDFKGLSSNYLCVTSFSVELAAQIVTLSHASRGSLIYDPTKSTKWVWSSGKSEATAFDASNSNHQWMFYPTGTDSQFYLYNVGAQKFAVPTTGGSYNGVSWKFSYDAAPVALAKQDDGTYKIYAPYGDRYMSVSNNYVGPIINYNDDGAKFSITLGDDASSGVWSQLTTAVNHLVGNITKLTTTSDFTTDGGWYVIKVNNGSWVGHSLFTAEKEIIYNGTNYPIGFYGYGYEDASIANGQRLFRITKVDGGFTWQMPNGKYLYNPEKSFPLSTTDAVAISIGKSDAGFSLYHKSTGTNQYTRYATAYNLSSTYFVGETATATNIFDIYPADLTSAGLVAWQVLCDDAPETAQIVCSRNDVSGLTSVYKNGYIFLPTGVTPENTDFTLEGATSITVDANAKTVTLEYNPDLSIVAEGVSVTQGYQTAGRGNENTLLLRIDVTPFAGMTSANLTVSLKDETKDNISSLYLYESDALEFIANIPNTKLATTTDFSTGKATLNLGDVTTGTHHYWLCATVKSDAALGTILDAAVTNIGYTSTSDSPKAMSCDLTDVGDPSKQGAKVFALQNFVFKPTTEDCRYYRIPSMMLDKNGDVVVAIDKRYNSDSDLGNHKIDVYSKRSEDGGVTWQDVALIAAGDGSSAAAYGYGDAGMVRSANGDLVCVMAAGSKRWSSDASNGMMYSGVAKSSDNGKTWTLTPNIFSTSNFYDEVHSTQGSLGFSNLFTTAGKGLTTNDGILMFTTNCTEMGTTSPALLYILYSTDNGTTWRLSNALAYSGCDESKLEQLSDGSLLVSVRQSGNRGWNKATYTKNDDGTVTFNWGTQYRTSDITGNACNADIINYGREMNMGDDVLIHSYINSSARESLQLAMSLDGGNSWKDIYNIQPNGSCYSTMQVLADGSLAILFEDESYSAGNGYAINYITIAKEQIDAWYEALYDDKYNPLVKNSVQGSATGANSYGSFTDASNNWAKVWTSNASSGVAGLTIVSPGYAFNHSSVYSQRCLAMRPSADGATDEITITAPAGYYIDSYTITGRNYSVSQTYQLYVDEKAKTTTSTSGATFSVDNVNAQSTSFKFYGSSASSNYLCITNFTIQLRSKYPVKLNTVGDASYATLYLPFDVTTDANTKAYVIKTVGTESATLTELENGEIAAKTAVVLVNETSNAAAFTVASETLTQQVAESENYLKGTLVSQELDLGDGTPYYSMGKIDDKIGFYKFDDKGTTTITLGANKAYLDTTTGNVKGFTLSFGGEDGIGQVVSDESVNGTWYDLNGRRLSGAPAAKGVYIVGGKKVVVK